MVTIGYYVHKKEKDVIFRYWNFIYDKDIIAHSSAILWD
jgi:hypothetical protein